MRAVQCVLVSSVHPSIGFFLPVHVSFIWEWSYAEWVHAMREGILVLLCLPARLPACVLSLSHLLSGTLFPRVHQWTDRGTHKEEQR